jgi:hypothetical protein
MDRKRHKRGALLRLSAFYLRPLWKMTGPSWWVENRLAVIGFCWLGALTVGLIGVIKQPIAPNMDRSWSDIVYQTLQLPLMQSRIVDKPVNGWLDFARFFAPFMTLVTSLQAAALLLGDRIQGFRLKHFCRRHVIICGLGRKGTLLADEFRDSGESLVLIERNATNAAARRFREEGVIVLIGDATDSTLLRKAQVGRANRIICLCSDDETNAQICMQSWELPRKGRREPSSCLVQLVSPELCELLRLEMVKKDPGDQFRVEFFNIFQMGAWALLEQFPPFEQNRMEDDKVPHVVIVGLGRFGQDVLLRIARKWKAYNSQTGCRCRLTVVDKDAERKTRALCIAYRKLGALCEIIPHICDIQSGEFEENCFLSDDQGSPDVSGVYVCLSDQSLGLRAALSIHQRLRGTNTPIVVRMSDSRGMSALLERKRGTVSRFRSIRPFNLIENTCQTSLVCGVTTEILAQAIHVNYLEGLRAAHVNLTDVPAAVPWEELPEVLKESNRRQAYHIGAKLDAVGCGLAPLRDWDAELLRFTPQEEEELARMEHQRWCDERIADGWTLGPRDDKRKIHPCMVPWEQLNKEDKDKDRQAVLDLPKLLSSIDLQIYRVAVGNQD